VRTGYKYIATILLLVPLLAPAIFTITFQLQQQNIRHRMKERLEEKHLHSLTIQKDDIHWVKAGKEIAIGNRLFDIKSMGEGPDGTVTVIGLFDHEESLLVQQLKEQQEEQDSNSLKTLVQFFNLILTIPGLEEAGHPGVCLLPLTQYPDISVNLPSVFHKILTPPPQA
jgi:hypothetical protein